MQDTNATIEFSAAEAQEIVQLLDIAVRAQGLGVAAAALRYANCFQQAFMPKEPESPAAQEPSV